MTKKARKKKRLRVSVLLFYGFLLWLGFTFGKEFVRNYSLNRELAKLTNEIQAVELRNEQIRLDIERFSSPEHLERVAREELGLVKPGEMKYIITELSNEP